MKYFVIGDIHGRYDKLLDILKFWEKEETLVFLGDYIDRGKESYEVLDVLSKLQKYYPTETVFLRGNHEEMFLQVYRDFDEKSMYLENSLNLWKSNGGTATIRSFPFKNKGVSMDKKALRIRGEFRYIYDFIEETKPYYEVPGYIFVHAGIPMEELEGRWRTRTYDMLWIREEFFQRKNTTGKTIIFGHTPVWYIHKTREDAEEFNKLLENKSYEDKVSYFKLVAVPYIDKENKYLGIDTGCYITNRITGVKINKNIVEEIITW